MESIVHESWRHQLGLIAQGLMQLVAAVNTKSVWGYFGSWMRTIRLAFRRPNRFTRWHSEMDCMNFSWIPERSYFEEIPPRKN
jgi:hypothetical protein